MHLKLRRPPRSLEQPGCCHCNSSPYNEWYGDALAHGERLDTRYEVEYPHLRVVATAMDTETLVRDRNDKDEFFRISPHSPIPGQEQVAFGGLAYFDPNPDLVFTVEPEPVEPSQVTIETTTGDSRTYRRVATANVVIDDTEVSLALYSTGHDGLFLPFRDATSGRETYGAGRYLDVDPNEDGTITIDFNYAYAPFCAYSAQYSCALPPQENWMTVAVEAGERSLP
jgi:hypothetical protein